MDFSPYFEWLSQYKDAFSSLEIIMGIIGSIIGGIWAWKKSRKPNSNNPTNQNSSQNQQINVSINMGDHADTRDIPNFYSYDDEKVMQLKAKLPPKYKDEGISGEFQTITEVQKEQHTDKYKIQEALDFLNLGETEKAKNIFELIALEQRQRAKNAQLKEATVLRYIGSIDSSHNIPNALEAYKRSTELEIENIEGWNQLGRLYFIAGAFDDAEKAFLKVIDLSGSDREAQAIAYGNLGVLYKARNEWDKTLSTLRTSIINPKAG